MRILRRVISSWLSRSRYSILYRSLPKPWIGVCFKNYWHCWMEWLTFGIGDSNPPVLDPVQSPERTCISILAPRYWLTKAKGDQEQAGARMIRLREALEQLLRTPWLHGPHRPFRWTESRLTSAKQWIKSEFRRCTFGTDVCNYLSESIPVSEYNGGTQSPNTRAKRGFKGYTLPMWLSEGHIHLNNRAHKVSSLLKTSNISLTSRLMLNGTETMDNACTATGYECWLNQPFFQLTCLQLQPWEAQYIVRNACYGYSARIPCDTCKKCTLRHPAPVNSVKNFQVYYKWCILTVWWHPTTASRSPILSWCFL